MGFVNSKNIEIFKAVVNGETLDSVGLKYGMGKESVRQKVNKTCRLIGKHLRMQLLEYTNGVLVPMGVVSYSPKFIEDTGLEVVRKNSELWCRAADDLFLPRDNVRDMVNYCELDTPQRYRENGADLPPVINPSTAPQLATWANSFLTNSGASNVNH